MVELDYQLSKADLAAYAHDGAVALRSVIPHNLLARLQTAAHKARDLPGGFWYTIYLWRNDPDFRACCMDSAAPAIAAQLLSSSKINLLYDQLFIKPPSGESTPWHHDLPYWPIEGNAVVSLWIALSEVTQSNGGLEFIAGSHLWGRQLRTFSVDVDSGEYTEAIATDDREPIPAFEDERHNYNILHWDLQPGDAVAFHALTLHHAPANRDPKSARTGYALRFMGDDVRYKESPGMNRLVFNPHLNTGDTMDSEQYPVVFPRARTASKTSGQQDRSDETRSN